MKTHFAYCEQATESDNQTYWSNTLCGLEYTESPLSDNISYVSCKKCLKIHEKIRNRMKQITENNIK